MTEATNLKEINIEDLFYYNEVTGKYVLQVPMLDTEISINDEIIETDVNGNIDEEIFLEANAETIEQSIYLSSEQDSVNFDGDIHIIKNFQSFAEGIQSMEDNMEQVEGQATQVFHKKVAVGKTLGNGAGKSKVSFDTNIVGCNKHDKNTKSINAAQFAIQSSDCAMSVRLGLLYATDPLGNAKKYKMSYNCVLEAVTNVDGKSNSYCDGKKKSGKVNCSWFTGIGHSESFHTHK